MRLFVATIGCLSVLAVFTTGMSQESPPTPLPATPQLTIHVEPASLAITGIVSSEGHKAILTRTAHDRFPGKPAQFDVEVRPALPPGWALVTDQALRTMAFTRSATAEITPTVIEIAGITGDEEAWSRAAGTLDQYLLQGMRFDHRIEKIGLPAPLERQCIALFRTAIRGRKIEFPQSGAELGTAAHPLLDELIQIAVDCPTAKILITGHTDSTGAETLNTALSRARAEAVGNYLVTQGIPASRVAARGVGSSEPMVDGTDARARQLNRRIEFDLQFP